MKAPERLYVEVCEDGIFAFPKPPFEESVEYVRADVVRQPASEGLEEEIDLWISENENIHLGDKLMVSLLKDVARYFAEWGAEHLKK